MYGLTPEDLELQARARGFADELIPHEQYAEEHGGELPEDVEHRLEGPGGGARTHRDQHPGRARRPRLLDAAAGARAGAGRTRDQRAGMVPDDPARLVGRGRQRPPARHLPDPDRRGPARGLLRDHRGVRRLRRVRPEGDRRPRRRRLRPQRREVARDVVQPVRPRLLPGRPDDRRACRRAGDVRRRQRHPGHPRGAHPGVLPHLRPPPPDRGVRRRPRAGQPPDRRRGRRDVVRLRVVPLRAADDRGALPRRGRAAGRRDAGLRGAAPGRRASTSPTSSSCRACSPTA